MSFTIKCDSCGNEAKITESEHDIHHYKYWKSDNDSLRFKYDSDHSFIACEKCRNEIGQDR